LTIEGIFPDPLETACKRASEGVIDVIAANLDTPPTCASPMKEQLAPHTDGLFGDRDARYQAITEKIIYAKTLDWQHEGEYRLCIPLATGGEPWNTLPYHPEEITELYLGAEMVEADKQAIIAFGQGR